MVRVAFAQRDDIPAWLVLAAEVEPLFGLMAKDPGFVCALQRNVDRGTARCARAGDDGPPGVLLLGGLLSSPKPSLYTIGWLAVTRLYRRRGIGRTLIEHVFSLVETSAEFGVTALGADSRAGLPARCFYERMRFLPAELAPNGPEGGSRQVYRRMSR